jgi:hypothetical protein
MPLYSEDFTDEKRCEDFKFHTVFCSAIRKGQLSETKENAYQKCQYKAEV